ncbi:arylesterase [Leptospira biflexa]|uniref:arylesterase n=1 Tax=Leptospira biflexa TaxID=172 RepID=UPI001090D158|nr:arylesterase [Leptospira biflexa]TGM46896.1 arylesterase [Leptospira biflexa]TGM50638.1 arylesterase [Leptospira biflexa]
MRITQIWTILTIFTLFTSIVACGGQIQEKPIVGCERISGTPGPEDFDLIRETATIIVSSHERRNGLKDIGALFEISFANPNQKLEAKKIETNYPKNFRPHGISYAKINGVDTLAVISHTLDDDTPHTLEIFERTKVGKWTHTKTLSDPSLTSPNDIFMNESGEIFTSNDNGTSNAFRKYWDMIIRSGRADISYYNGNTFQNLGVPVMLGNGIYIRKNGKQELLYRSVFSEKAIRVYEVNRENGKISLKYLESIAIGAGPDNILEDESGMLWLAAHDSTYKFIRHVMNRTNLAPTRVFKINPNTKEVIEVYANEGGEISAGSTGLAYKDKLLISQVFEDFLLVCPRP